MSEQPPSDDTAQPPEPAQALVDSVSGIESGPALDGLVARRLAAFTPDEAAQVIADLVARAQRGPEERKALAAICRALLWGPPELPPERRKAIRSAASSLGLGPVTALLTEATAERALDRESRRLDPELAPLTLGHRTQIARVESNPDRIARLATDDDPSVIRNLLLNPRLTEATVVRIAARRPVAAAVLAEVARSRKWALRRAVRRAIVLNPYAAPQVANHLLPQLIDEDLAQVATSEVLHPAVRRAAGAILEERGA